MLCERAVIELREKYPHIKLHLVLPCPAEEQTAKWNESDKREFMELLSAADMVEVCSEHYYDGCMKVRNQRHGTDRQNGGEKAHLYYQPLKIKKSASSGTTLFFFSTLPFNNRADVRFFHIINEPIAKYAYF